MSYRNKTAGLLFSKGMNGTGTIKCSFSALSANIHFIARTSKTGASFCIRSTSHHLYWMRCCSSCGAFIVKNLRQMYPYYLRVRSAENFAAFWSRSTRSGMIDTKRRSDVTKAMLVRIMAKFSPQKVPLFILCGVQLLVVIFCFFGVLVARGLLFRSIFGRVI